MNDKFSRIINQLRITLEEKKQEKLNLNQEINHKNNEIESTKQKIASCIDEEKQLQENRRSYKYYWWHTLGFIFTFVLIGACYPAALAFIWAYYNDALAQRARIISMGLVSSVSTKAPVIWAVMAGGLALGVVVGLTLFMRTLIKEKKEINTIRQRYSSLDEIEGLLRSKQKEHQNLNTLLTTLMKEKDELSCRCELTDLAINTLVEKITLAKDAFVEACSQVNNKEVETKLNGFDDQSLFQGFAELEKAEKEKKTAILARVKADDATDKK